MASSMGLRNTKNIQSAVSSNVFVGLCAETLHAIDMHATKFHSDDGVDIFAELTRLSEQVNELTDKLNNLTLKDLKDVDVNEVTDGDTLIYTENSQWKAATLS
jgi:hypothetical protein